MLEVLISIQPKWIEKICNQIGVKDGKPLYEKPIEVRKTRPKLETPFKVRIYCTNNKSQYLRKLGTSCREIFITESKDILGKTDKVKSIIGDTTTFWENGGYNGKVIGEFVCDRIDEYANGELALSHNTDKTCLTNCELADYIEGSKAYFWHITDLKIYDKPKELSEFKVGCKGCKEKDTYHCKFYCRCERPLERPPQSWCYVEV